MKTTRSGESALLSLDVVDLLTARNIEYAMSGALAASMHGAVRASMDAEVLLFGAIRGTGELDEDFVLAGLDVVRTEGDPNDPIAGLVRVTDAFGNRVDLLLGLRGTDVQARAGPGGAVPRQPSEIHRT